MMSYSKKIISISIGLAALVSEWACGQAAIPSFTPRWKMDQHAIVLNTNVAHQDQLEMSGRQVSAVIDYGRDAQGRLQLKRTVVWPMLRTIPDDTHASLIRRFDITPNLKINDQAIDIERLQQVRFDGQLQLQSTVEKGVQLTRLLSPAPDEPALIERLRLHNGSGQRVRYQFDELKQMETTDAAKGTFGSYVIQVDSPARSGVLEVGQSITVDVLYRARLENEMVYIDVDEQLAKRRQKIQEWSSKLVLETPEPALNLMFNFAKLRAVESIFATRGGLLHGPGGTRYYAAIWANDQAEYANPFFPYLGDATGVQSAITSFRLFATYMNPEYTPIPSSIVAEGRSYWNGAGDRGDCAMIAYGASQFVMAQGDEHVAQQFQGLIDWCLEFSRKKRDRAGIIHSDSDELEGRFPAGKANLSTNVLLYGGLMGASYLSADQQKKQALQTEAQALRSAIDGYFAANVGGYSTYRYYEGNDKLRAWIVLPLVFGMEERKAGTVAAVLSDQLWSANGLLSEAGSKTYWDRSTLYGFRGLMKVGELEKVMPYFRYYSNLRLLGDHVPYAIEAWPEGNQRHLSAESALYARVLIEGLFGIEAKGLRRFTMTPRLPKEWPSMALKNIRAFGAGKQGEEDAQSGLDILTKRTKQGQQVQVRLHGKLMLNTLWDGKEAIEVVLPK